VSGEIRFGRSVVLCRFVADDSRWRTMIDMGAPVVIGRQ
jgi:hypothetical protein